MKRCGAGSSLLHQLPWEAGRVRRSLRLSHTCLCCSHHTQTPLSSRTTSPRLMPAPPHGPGAGGQPHAAAADADGARAAAGRAGGERRGERGPVRPRAHVRRRREPRVRAALQHVTGPPRPQVRPRHLHQQPHRPHMPLTAAWCSGVALPPPFVSLSTPISTSNLIAST
jgi:hypothetical protein